MIAIAVAVHLCDLELVCYDLMKLRLSEAAVIIEFLMAIVVRISEYHRNYAKADIHKIKMSD